MTREKGRNDEGRRAGMTRGEGQEWQEWQEGLGRRAGRAGKD